MAQDYRYVSGDGHLDVDKLNEMVAEADSGGRKPTGVAAKLLFAVALGWSLFQLWYASPLPYIFGVGVLSDGLARNIHLAFALFLAATTYPAFKKSSRGRIPAADFAVWS